MTDFSLSEVTYFLVEVIDNAGDIFFVILAGDSAEQRFMYIVHFITHALMQTIDLHLQISSLIDLRDLDILGVTEPRSMMDVLVPLLIDDQSVTKDLVSITNLDRITVSLVDRSDCEPRNLIRILILRFFFR